MKVALIYHGCHRKGGVERLVFEAARYLAARRHEVHVFAEEWEEAPAPPGGAPISYHRVPAPSGPDPLRMFRFYVNSTRLVRQIGFDVLNSHGVFCPEGGVHWANSVHRAYLERSRKNFSPLSARRMRQRLNPQHALILRQERRHFTQGGYQSVIAASRQVAEDLHRLYGAPSADIEVIHNGLDPEDFNPARRLARRAAERAKLGVADHEVALLMVANELERKGLPTLLTALQKLARPELKLLVAGRAQYAAYLPRIAALGLKDRVRFVGSSSDVAAFHAAADLFVLPTQYEAFCLAILEALGSGLPVVTTTVPGAGDVIQPGVNGLLMHDPLNADELAAHIETLLDEPTRRRMQEQAAFSVEPYHWHSILSRYETILARCACVPVNR